jgi:hypothetical protein
MLPDQKPIAVISAVQIKDPCQIPHLTQSPLYNLVHNLQKRQPPTLIHSARE